MKKYENCYVYKIVNNIDNLIYIGSTTNSLFKRMTTHKINSRCSKFKNRKIYNHMNLYGEDKFKIEPIEEFKNIGRDELRKYEDKYIKEFNTVINGLNTKYEVGINCDHNTRRNQCLICHGNNICSHNKQKWFCLLCNGTQVCEHDKQKKQCKACNDYKCDFCDKHYGSIYSMKKHAIICVNNPINNINSLL